MAVLVNVTRRSFLALTASAAACGGRDMPVVWQATPVVQPAALDYYPGGLVVPDPYANYPTWYVDAVSGVDVGSPGNVKPAGWTYQTYDNALLDVFYVGNPGLRRIVVKPTGTYYPGGSQFPARGSYFPAGGPDAAHLCVIQGDPSNSTLPLVDAQLNGASNITGIVLGATTQINFGDPLAGPSRQPFTVGQSVQFANITGTTQLNGVSGTITSVGGSAGAWNVVVSINSTGYGAWVSGGQIWNGISGGAQFSIGNQGGFGTPSTTASNLVIRKFECINSVANSVYVVAAGGSVSNINIEYCSFHGNRYPYSNPGSSGAIGFERPENAASNIKIKNCKFFDIGTRPGQGTSLGASADWNVNCVPFETYGCDNVTISNCSFENAYVAVRQKLFNNASGAGGSGNGSNGGGTGNNWTIQNCLFANNYCVFMEGTGSSLFNATSNFIFAGNLIYGPTLHVTGGNQAGFWVRSGTPNTVGSNILIAGNTFGEDLHSESPASATGFAWLGATGVAVRDNIMMGDYHTVTFPTSDSADSPVVFTQLDYNAYSVNTIWTLDYNGTNPLYKYTTFAQWQAANTNPLDHTGAPTSPAPPDLATIGNPDSHGRTFTESVDIPGFATRNYAIAGGSALLTGSSTGGRMGYDPTNIGPGW